jgi:hypothetical protein
MVGQAAIHQAAKRRQIFSLGREPQEVDVPELRSPEGATDRGCGVSRSHHLPCVCRRFAAEKKFRTVFLGLTPQAMSIPPLRGWFG